MYWIGIEPGMRKTNVLSAASARMMVTGVLLNFGSVFAEVLYLVTDEVALESI
jgi:hypothetical protein